MFADLERSLSKSPGTNIRGRTCGELIREGRAPENESSDCIIQTNWEGAGCFLKREREKEPQRMMTMIVSGNKRDVFFHVDD